MMGLWFVINGVILMAIKEVWINFTKVMMRPWWRWRILIWISLCFIIAVWSNEWTEYSLGNIVMKFYSFTCRWQWDDFNFAIGLKLEDFRLTLKDGIFLFGSAVVGKPKYLTEHSHCTISYQLMGLPFNIVITTTEILVVFLVLWKPKKKNCRIFMRNILSFLVFFFCF